MPRNARLKRHIADARVAAILLGKQADGLENFVFSHNLSRKVVFSKCLLGRRVLGKAKGVKNKKPPRRGWQLR